MYYVIRGNPGSHYAIIIGPNKDDLRSGLDILCSHLICNNIISRMIKIFFEFLQNYEDEAFIYLLSRMFLAR